MTLHSDDELGRLLALTREVDSVELKLSVPDGEQRSAVRALDLDPLDAQIRQVFFFDTPNLALDGAGLIVRGRRVQSKGDDSVVKLRPVEPADLPEELRRSPDFVVEVDAMPGGHVCSASFKSELPEPAVKDVAAGRLPVRRLLSKAQRAFFDRHAPEGVTLDDLVVLGPITVFKLKHSPPQLGRPLVAELWLYPDGSRILELSTRCRPTEPFQVAAEARAFLAERGISLAGEQQTKTRAALTLFARTLGGNDDAAGGEEASP